MKHATTAGSASAVAWGSVTGKPSTYAPSSHTHDIGNITGGPSTWSSNGLTAAKFGKVVLVTLWKSLNMNGYWASQKICTLPSGWRPKYETYGHAAIVNANANLTLVVKTDGSVNVNSWSGADAARTDNVGASAVFVTA